MFFILSKVLWHLVNPLNFIFLIIILATSLLWTRWHNPARLLLTAVCLVSITIFIFPVGSQFNKFLENRFPIPQNMPPSVNGIIVLGGAIDQFVTKARGEISMNGSIERIFRFAHLASTYPNAKLVYSGGSGYLTRQDLKEADVVSPLLALLGVDTSRVIFENSSRNTYENAIFSFNLITPKKNEVWILVTSAVHMPRAIGCFRQAGWSQIIAFPTDFRFEGDEKFGPPLSFSKGFSRLGSAIYELLGLTVYYITGKTGSFIPEA